MVHTDPHHQQEKDLVPVPTPQGEIMWVHPDLVDGQQWTIVTNRKSKGKRFVLQCRCASSREAETDIPSLTNLEEETITLAAEINKPLATETRSGQSYLKKYDEMVANPPKLTPEPTKQPMEKQKELRYAKALPKDKVEGSLRPYHLMSLLN